MNRIRRFAQIVLILSTLALLLTTAASAHDPDFTDDFDRDRCHFTTTGTNPYFPLWPGYVLEFEGEEEDDEGDMVEIGIRFSVLKDTELVDGVLTRVIEEFETEDGELVEISRNFFAICRETGDVWYFGEDVDDYEDGVIVGHSGVWRSGVDGARAGILIQGTPLLGARHFQEVAPGVALDRVEVVSMDESLNLPFGNFDGLLKFEETSGLDPDDFSEKWYAHGIGLVKDDAADLVDITVPPCLPDATTLCLQNGRFEVVADWVKPDGTEGDAMAILPSADTGEFYFFKADNTELLVKVLNGCNNNTNAYWVFAAGLTNVEVTLTVTDTETGQINEYENDQGNAFEPILDTSAFMTCP